MIPSTGFADRVSVIAPGIAATLIVALAATCLSDHYHVPPVIFALLLGMALNQLSCEARYAPGINVSARTLLRISVALLGLRITFGQIGELGWSTAAMVAVTVPLDRVFLHRSFAVQSSGPT